MCGEQQTVREQPRQLTAVSLYAFLRRLGLEGLDETAAALEAKGYRKARHVLELDKEKLEKAGVDEREQQRAILALTSADRAAAAPDVIAGFQWVDKLRLSLEFSRAYPGTCGTGGTYSRRPTANRSPAAAARHTARAALAPTGVCVCVCVCVRVCVYPAVCVSAAPVCVSAACVFAVCVSTACLAECVSAADRAPLARAFVHALTDDMGRGLVSLAQVLRHLAAHPPDPAAAAARARAGAGRLLPLPPRNLLPGCTGGSRRRGWRGTPGPLWNTSSAGGRTWCGARPAKTSWRRCWGWTSWATAARSWA